MTTTQFTPTADELHWLATRLMGREIVIDDFGFTYYSSPSEGILTSLWKPHQDRNQSALLIERVGELGLKNSYVSSLDQLIDPGNQIFYFPIIIWRLITATPAQQVQAILELREEIEKMLEGQG